MFRRLAISMVSDMAPLGFKLRPWSQGHSFRHCSQSSNSYSRGLCLRGLRSQTTKACARPANTRTLNPITFTLVWMVSLLPPKRMNPNAKQASSGTHQAKRELRHAKMRAQERRSLNYNFFSTPPREMYTEPEYYGPAGYFFGRLGFNVEDR